MRVKEAGHRILAHNASHHKGIPSLKRILS